MVKKKGSILFLTGIPGAGKSTLARKLCSHFEEKGIPVALLDGDEIRDFFDNDLGFDIGDRLHACKRIIFGAKLLSENGINVIVAIVLGQDELHKFYEQKLEFTEFFLNADVNDCIKNDPKGFYAKKLKLESPKIIGYDIPFQKPSNPDLILNTHKETLDESFDKIINHLNQKKIL